MPTRLIILIVFACVFSGATLGLQLAPLLRTTISMNNPNHILVQTEPARQRLLVPGSDGEFRVL